MTARVAVETARESVAALVGARSREVVFTSGATESIGAATWGALERGASDGRRGVVLAAVEHSAVRQWAERGDARVVGVDSPGSDRSGRTDGRRGRLHRPRPRPVGQPRGRDHPAGGRGRRRLPGSGRAGPRRRGEWPRATCRSTSSASESTSCRSRATSSAHRPAPAPWWSDGACGSHRCWSVVTRSGPDEPVSRTWSERSASAPPRARPWDRSTAESARSTSLTDRVLAWAGATDGITVFGDPDHRLPHLVCLGLEVSSPSRC